MSAMSLTLDLSVGELASTRFAISPLSETIAGLQQLGVWRGKSHLPWTRWASAELAVRPLAMPRTWPLIVNDRPSFPQFLLPAPGAPETTIEDNLAELRRTTDSQVRASLQRSFGGDLPASAAELAADPAAGLRAIAAELREAHARLIAPHWPRIKAVLEADIAYRARQQAAGGAARLFGDLHPDLRWNDGRLTLIDVARGNRESRALAPGGLVLMPLVLGPPYVLVKLHTTTLTTVRYPARGAAVLWSAGTRPAPGSTVRLLGRRRAVLLEVLRSPATTSDLARALKVSPSAISQHVVVLRDSGLVASERSGRTVLHRTTERGLALLEPQPQSR
jgi:DNA-binding transcriptional ArsR family regulator